FFQAEDGIRDFHVTGVQTCALPIFAMVPGAQPGVIPTLTADQLLGAVPELAAFTALRAESFRTLPGAHLSFDDIVQLSVRINDRSEERRVGKECRSRRTAGQKSKD